MKTSHKALITSTVGIVIAAATVVGAISSYTMAGTTTATQPTATVITQQAMSLAPFHTLVAKGHFNLTLNQASLPTLQMTSQGTHASLTSEESNGRLVLDNSQNHWEDESPANITLSTPTAPSNIELFGHNQLMAQHLMLTDLNLSSDGHSRGTLQGTLKNLTLTLHGHSDWTINVGQANSVTLTNYGHANLTLVGHVNSLTITNNGKLQLSAKQLQAQNVGVSCNGRCTGTVNATQSLAVNGAGHVDINYYGHPQAVNQSGFGNIHVEAAGT